MDVLAVKQACKFAKEYALQNGPIVSTIFLNLTPNQLEDCHMFTGLRMFAPITYKHIFQL